MEDRQALKQKITGIELEIVQAKAHVANLNVQLKELRVKLAALPVEKIANTPRAYQGRLDPETGLPRKPGRPRMNPEQLAPSTRRLYAAIERKETAPKMPTTKFDKFLVENECWPDMFAQHTLYQQAISKLIESQDMAAALAYYERPVKLKLRYWRSQCADIVFKFNTGNERIVSNYTQAEVEQFKAFGLNADAAEKGYCKMLGIEPEPNESFNMHLHFLELHRQGKVRDLAWNETSDVPGLRWKYTASEEQSPQTVAKPWQVTPDEPVASPVQGVSYVESNRQRKRHTNKEVQAMTIKERTFYYELHGEPNPDTMPVDEDGNPVERHPDAKGLPPID